jgi:phosphatidate cytidylyltransferase
MALVGAVALGMGRGPFAIVAGLVILAAQAEFYGVITRRRHQPATALGLVGGALILAGGYFHGEPAMLAMFGLSIVATFVWYMSTPVQHRVNVVSNIGLTLFGIAWIPLMASPLLVVLRVEPSGRALVLSVLAMVFAYDTAAFAVGSLWGDTPLAPSVSPRKSVQGAIGATFVVIIIGLVALPSIDGVDWAGAGLLAIAVAILAPMGDLAESVVKRDLGVKDMGSILPGHGGVLDRIDSVLLVAPAALVILRMVLSG